VSVAPKLTSMVRRGNVAMGAGDGRCARESREDVVAGVAKMAVPSGGRCSDEDIECGNTRWEMRRGSG
jgi:hypothetical protein